MSEFKDQFNFAETRSKDEELFRLWKDTGDKKHLGALVKQVSPLLYREVKRQQGSLPPAALMADAKKWALRGINSYDPSKGAKLGTHITNWVKKIRRLNETYQNAVRLPANLHYKWGEFNNAVTQLSSTLNREPTDKELASHLGWKQTHVAKFKNSLYADYFESNSAAPTETTQFDTGKIALQYVIENLTPEEKIIFMANESMSSAELSKQIGRDINGLNYRKQKLRDKVMRLK